MTNDRILTRVTTLGGNDPWAQGQSFMTVEQLQAQIASLSAEVERLRALVKFAYFEGFEDGDIWGKVAEWWPTTETRAALQPKEGNQ